VKAQPSLEPGKLIDIIPTPVTTWTTAPWTGNACLTLFDLDYTGSPAAIEIDSALSYPDNNGHNPTLGHFRATPETS
jgi:hypothetical protein